MIDWSCGRSAARTVATAVVGLAIATVVNWRRANRLARELGV
jgi:hypothetical protein